VQVEGLHPTGRSEGVSNAGGSLQSVYGGECGNVLGRLLVVRFEGCMIGLVHLRGIRRDKDGDESVLAGLRIELGRECRKDSSLVRRCILLKASGLLRWYISRLRGSVSYGASSEEMWPYRSLLVVAFFPIKYGGRPRYITIFSA